MQAGKEIRTIREVIDAAVVSPPSIAVLFWTRTGSAASFLELQQNSKHFCAMLRQAGMARTAKVAFLMDEGPLSLQLLLGAMYGGFTAVPLKASSGARQLALMIEDCGARLILVAEPYAGLLADALTEVRGDVRVVRVAGGDLPPEFETVTAIDTWERTLSEDPALLLYRSSGSGTPKAAIYTQATALEHVWKPLASGQIATANLDLWEERLEDVPAHAEWYANGVRNDEESGWDRSFCCKLNNDTKEALRRASERESVSLCTVLASALDTLLYRHTGNEEILLGVSVADNGRQGADAAAGTDPHMELLNTRIAGEMSFRELLRSMEPAVENARAPRSNGGAAAQRGKEQRTAAAPLLQLMVNWGDGASQRPFIGADGTADSGNASCCGPKFNLLLRVSDATNGIALEMRYNRDRFAPEEIARMMGRYEVLLKSGANDAAQELSKLEILPEAERRLVLYDWNDTKADYHSDTFVHLVIEEQAARTPEATALVFEGASLSYAELNAQANQLAHRLRATGVCPDSRVAVCAERSLEMVIALLAILKAGGAYMPLDPTYPEERLQFMIEDADPVAVLTQKHLKGFFLSTECTAPVIDLTDRKEWSSMPANNPNPKSLGLTPQHLAYVIYTSGSTGKPKGVMLQHQGLCNRLDWMQSAYGMNAADGVLQKTPFGFDVSVWEFFWPLMVGARLVVARPEGHKDPAYLVETIRKNRVTTAHFVPSMLQAFLDYPEASSCTTLVRVVCSGEALPAALARRFVERLPHAALHNLYGPTEATVDVTAWSCPANRPPERIPIGRPIANTRMYILDAHQQPVPVGVPGELYIAGVQVARGYLSRPELSAAKFLADPFTSGADARMYRTGDLARWQDDGNIEYLGRNDFQVKIRGFRIELGEIENELMKRGDLRQCVVTAQGSDAEKRLVAYLVAGDTAKAASVENLRTSLLQRLPDYMVPSVFVFIDEIPLTANGKTDVKKLMQAEAREAERETPVEAPRDEVEARLAAIWERVLGVHPIGIRNNFFDMGGYSLVIMKLFTQINKAFDRSLPIATIFSYPTIEQLADLIRGSAIERSALVPLRDRGSKAPLFIVHSYLTYERFRQVMDEDRPLYGLHEHEDECIGSVQDRVNEYARLIREAQAEGPYYLIGWCAAGPITVEIARKLEADGGKVAMVGLIDAVHPSYMAEMQREDAKERHLNRFQEWKKYHLRRHQQFKNVSKARYFAGAVRDTAIRWIRGAILQKGNLLVRLASRRGIKMPRFVDHLASVHIEHLEPYQGKIALFRPLETNKMYHDQSLGWHDQATKGVEIVWTPGNHETMFMDGHVEKFGELLERIMSRNTKASVNPSATRRPVLVAARQ